jgi:hypothetical protein
MIKVLVAETNCSMSTARKSNVGNEPSIKALLTLLKRRTPVRLVNQAFQVLGETRLLYQINLPAVNPGVKAAECRFQ